MEIVIAPDPESTADRCAELLAGMLRDALAARGAAHLALNGGSTPRAVYERLPALLDDWSGVHVWWGDERCVPPDDQDSNYRMAAETLLAGAGIPDDRVHRIRGELGPDEGARAYAAELAEHLDADDAGLPVLDVVHLGLGPDGHTASLFPDHDTLEVTGWATVGEHDSPKPPPQRISLSLGCLNAARRLVLHAVGEEKRDALRHARAEPGPHTPASLLERQRLTIVVDQAAAGEESGDS